MSTLPCTVVRFSALSGVVCAFLLFAGAAYAKDLPPYIEADGTLHLQPLTLPPSGYWSPPFKAAYVLNVQGSLAHPMALPPMSAPQAEWDEFFAAADRGFPSALAQIQALYRATIETTQIGGVEVAIVKPTAGISRANERRVLINLHGGLAHGRNQGLLESIPIAVIGQIEVVTVDYRGEPGHAYPASSEDVAAVYRSLLEQYRPTAVGIFGSSLGGIITAQVIAWLQAKGLPPPGAAGIFWSGLPAAPFPWGNSGDSQIWGSDVPRPDRSAYQAMLSNVSWYLRAVSPEDHSAFPGSSDSVLARFPPTLFLSGTRAHDMSAAVVAHAHLLSLGVDSSLYIMEGGWHGAEIATPGTPEERGTDTYIARWFEQHLAQK
jgi:epsilon-lactone hydrolase